MSALQSQVIQSLNGLSDDNLQFILDMIQKFMKPANTENTVNSKASVRKIGIFEHEDLYDKDYDFDEYNEEIAKMFGVTD